MGEKVGDLPILTIQDPPDLQGAVVYDCPPPMLPVSLKLVDIGPLPLRLTVVSASLVAPPQEEGTAVSGVSPEGVAIPELGVASLADPGTDLEDEWPTPDDSPSVSASGPEGVSLLGVRPALPDAINLELEKALLDVSVLPVMVTPLVDPVVRSQEAPSSYPEPPLPGMPDDDQDPAAQISPLREVADSPILDVFPSYLASPAGPYMSRSPPRSRRPYGRTTITDHRSVRPRWTSTCREMVSCCGGIRRTCPCWNCR